MSRYRRPVALVVLLGLLSLGSAAGPPTDEPVSVSVKRNTTVLSGGEELLVRLEVACDPIGDLLEAFLMIHQDAAYGEGFFSPICDGERRTYLVRVPALDSLFLPGMAHASAFVLLCDPEGIVCEQGQDSRPVAVHGRRGR